jgi:hypothetical protein
VESSCATLATRWAAELSDGSETPTRPRQRASRRPAAPGGARHRASRSSFDAAIGRAVRAARRRRDDGPSI